MSVKNRTAERFVSDAAMEAIILAHLQPVDACPICGTADVRGRGVTPTIHPRSPIKVRLLECQTCLHWFVTPMPSQEALDSLYRSGSEYVVGSGGKGVKRRLSMPERYVIEQESCTARECRRYLEIGVGAGLLFDYFRSAGYRCSGVEPGAWGSGCSGVVGNKRDLEDSRYDVVVIADVLEHIRDPLDMLQFAASRMESGTLYACFPNSQSLRARLATSNWRMVRPFGHLHFFSKQSLTIMFESAGFILRDLQRTDLVDFSLRKLFWPPRDSLVKILMLPTQRFWGDQWIVQATKNG